jgi:hypothetical protein
MDLQLKPGYKNLIFIILIFFVIIIHRAKNYKIVAFGEGPLGFVWKLIKITNI